MPTWSELSGRYLGGGGGGGSAAPTVTPALPYNEDMAEIQREMRRFTTSGQVEADYAASRVHDSQEYAKRELDRLLELQAAGVDIPQQHLDELNSIVNPSFWQQALQKAAPVFKVLEMFDRPRQAITLGLKDLLGVDEGHGQEIDFDNYVQVLRGKREELINELGTDIVGEDGMVGFSTVLDDLGWEKTDNVFNKVVRGVATFGGEVLTDPLTFVSGGALGLAKAQRATELTSTVGRHQETLFRSLLSRNGDEIENIGDLGRRMWREGHERAEVLEGETWGAIERAVVDEADPTGVLAKYGIDVDFPDELTPSARSSWVAALREDAGLSEAIWTDAAKAASVESADRVLNRALPALMAKDWLDPGLREVADAMGSSQFLRGGIRLAVPTLRKGNKPLSATVPGTRGLGRRISNVLLGSSSEYAKAGRASGATGARRLIEEALAPNLYQRWTEAAVKFGDDGFWRKVQRGQFTKPAEALRVKGEFAQFVTDLGSRSGAQAIRRSAIKLNDTINEFGVADKDVQVLTRALGRVMETRPAATADELFESLREFAADAGGSLADVPREVVDAAFRWTLDQRAYFDEMYRTARAVGLVEGDGLENYTPHMLTGEANELLDLMIDKGIAPKGYDQIGDQILRALLEARRQARTIDEQVVGEAAATSTRTIGRTVMRGTGDTSIPYAIGDIILHDNNTFGRATMSVDELNAALRRSLDGIEEANPGFKRPKQGRHDLPFTVYEENGFKTVQAYGHDMMMAIAERRFLQLLENAGLVSDSVRFVNQQTLANSLQEKLGRFGEDIVAQEQAVTGMILDGKVDALRELRDGVADIEMVDVKVGKHTIQVPKASVEANKRLAREVEKLRKTGDRALEVQARADAFFADTYSALTKKGVDRGTAISLAQAATRKEVTATLKLARAEQRRIARRAVQHYRTAVAMSHDDVAREAALALQAQAAKVVRLDEQAKQLLEEFDAEYARTRAAKVAPVEPVASSAGATEVANQIRQTMVDDVRSIAQSLRDIGDTEAGRMVDEIANFLVRTSDRITPEIESLGTSIREILQKATLDYRQRVDQMQAINPQMVAYADRFMDQAEHYGSNILDPGNWGPDRYADARFVFHGTPRPSMAQAAHSRHWGGGGITANPVRAAAYAGDQWVLVWDLEEMPQAVRDIIRSGQDIEDRASWLTLLGVEGGTSMPAPVAILPAGAVREAAARRASDPELLTKLARNIASDTLYRVFERVDPVVFASVGDERFLQLVDRAMLDPSFLGSDEFIDDVVDTFMSTRLGRDPERNGPLINEWIDKFSEQLQQHREWARQGRPDPLTGKPYDVRWDEGRKAVMSVWYDNWKSKARKGAPMRTVGEPVSAPWVQSVELEGGNAYHKLKAALKGENTPDIQAYDAVSGELDYPSFIERLDMEWEAELHEARLGQLSPEMQDIYDASQVSLNARGLEDEFPAWVIDNEIGMARLSLVPIEDATVVTVRREDVLMDWGAMFPQQLDTLDEAARARRHQIMVDPSKVSVHEGAVDLGASVGMPPKTALHRMRPENLTYQKMLSIFGDAEVADEAFGDLLRRMDMLGPPNLDSLQALAEARGMSGKWFGSSRGVTPRERIGVLRNFEQLYFNPVQYGEMFANPDVQQWFAKQMREEFGHEYTFSRVTMVPDEEGGWRVGVRGQAGGVEATVPARVLPGERPATLTRKQLSNKLAELGVTVTEARMRAKRLAAARTSTQPLTAAEQAAEEFFEGNMALYNSLIGITDDMGATLDRAFRLLDEKASIEGRGGNLDALLGREGEAIPQAVAEANAFKAVDELRTTWRIDPDAPLGATVSLRTGRSATRGVAVSSGLGEIRIAAPGGVSEDIFDEINNVIADWVSVAEGALSRPGAHIGVWHDKAAGEFVIEVSGVLDSVASARRRGMDFNQQAVFDLATGKEISVPTTKSRLQAQVAEARRGQEAGKVLEKLDTEMVANRFDGALGILLEPGNQRILERELGRVEYELLLDEVKLERLLALDMVPGREARRAAQRARRLLSSNEKALEAAKTLRDEAYELREASLSDEVADIMETQARLSDLMGEILGVGFDAERRLGDESLYPRVEGRVTLEASEQTLARVEEAQELAASLGWNKTEKALDEILRDPPYAVLAPEGAGAGEAEHVFSVFGIGGTQTDYKTTTGTVAGMMEQAIARYQAITTPPGLDMFVKQTRAIARAWKTMATVSRVTFHPRNLVGGVFNNMAIDVRMKDYAWAAHNARKFQRLMDTGATLDEMAAEFGDDWRVIDAMRREGVLGEGFVRGDIDVELPRGAGAVRLRDRINPASGDFIGTTAGGAVMRSIEDFLRAAAFKRHFDDLGAAGARDMVNMVHFDYTNLSKMDRKIKKFVPFWVWTKNNIPLQMRLMMERPDIVSRYIHLMNAVDDNFGDDDDWPGNQFHSPFAADLGVRLGGDQAWANLVFDPDLPITDLQILDNPLSMEFVNNTLTNMLGPHVTLPFQVAEQNEWGSTNAPFGWNEALRVLDFFGIDQQVSAQGDAQVGYGTRNAMNTALPILGEYTGLLGLKNNPEALLRQGIDTSDGISFGERARGALTFLGRGFGVQATTPNDARVQAYTADERVREIMEELRLSGLLEPDVGQPTGPALNPEVLEQLAAFSR